MKKLIATVVLSSLALLPAASAWAGGSGPIAKELSSVTTSPGTRGTSGPSAEERVFSWGCRDHHIFVVFGDPFAGFSGSVFSLTWCDQDVIHLIS